MAVAQTQAARIMAEDADKLTSHQVISLLMGGALERILQAKQAVEAGNIEDKNILFSKVTAIVKGLRASLDMSKGGEIAENLDSLYIYIVERLVEVNLDEEMLVLEEVRRLIVKLKCGWDSMDLSCVDQLRAAS